MKINDIVQSVQKYYDIQKFTFHLDIIKKLSKISETNNQEIIEIPTNDPYLLEAFRIHVCFNNHDLKIGITNTKPTCCYRQINLNKYQLRNLIWHLLAIQKGSIRSFGMIDQKEIDKILNRFDDEIYVILSTISDTYFDKISLVTINNFSQIYPVSGILFGVESLNILKYQRLDRYVKIIDAFYALQRIETQVNSLNGYIENIINKLEWFERDRFIIFSGTTLLALGTTFTNDIDIMIVTKENKTYLDKIKKMFNELKGQYIDLDYTLLLNDGIWYKKDRTLEFQRQWLSYILPNFAGANDIYEIISNPTYFFYFMGLKFVSLKMNIIKQMSKNTTNKLTDLINMKKINNIDFDYSPCISNMNITYGVVTVNDSKIINKMLHRIQYLSKSWYGEEYTIDELKKKILLCSETKNIIQYDDIINDPKSGPVKQFHEYVKSIVVLKYCQNCESILDIGTNQTVDLMLWNIANVKNIIVIRSKISNVHDEEFIKSRIPNNMTLIDNFQNYDWFSNENQKIHNLKNKKFDCIIMFFSLQHMIKNISILMKNILNLTNVGSKIIIMCLDGMEALKKMDNKDKYEIPEHIDPIFGIYKYNYSQYNQQILVYMRGVYGVDPGSVEFVIDIHRLIIFFKSNGFNLLLRKKLSSFDTPNKKILQPYQLQILDLFNVLLFEKIK